VNSISNSIPQGRLKIGRVAILDNFQPSLRDSIMFHVYPGLTSWAKFSRPYGTECGNRVLTRSHPVDKPDTMIWATASARAPHARKVCPERKALGLFHLSCSSAGHGETKLRLDRLQ
jgi:hypothetical protein